MVSFFDSLRAFGRGFATTLGSAFTKPITVQYPEVKPPVQSRFRGKHMLLRYDNGLERCIGCSLCAIFCPAQAIYVEAAENAEAERYSPGERYARRYEINMLRCIYCGYCQEACPTEAIVLGHEYAFSDYTREALIYTKERLLVPTPEKVAGGQAAD